MSTGTGGAQRAYGASVPPAGILTDMTQAIRSTLAFLLTTTLAGCYEPTRGIQGDGTLSLDLTAAPFLHDSVARADVFIVRVEGMVRDIDSTEAAQAADAGTNTDPEMGFVTLATPNQLFNLLELQRGVTVDIGSTPLPLATYRGFRLILSPDQSSITLRNGAVLTASTTPGIQWPLGSRMDVRVELDQPIEVGFSETRMLVDFDLLRSFPQQSGALSADGVRFAAGIRGAIKDSTGAVSGTVRQDNIGGAPVADARVDVLKVGTVVGDTNSSKVIRSTRTDAQGNFKVSFVAPGTYAVRASPPQTLPLYLPALIGIVTIAPATDANGNLMVLEHN